MNITDVLREYANRYKNSHDAWSGIGDDLTAIADRIDAEHQKALDEWKAEHGQMWLKGYSECHAELLEGNETLASDLERCGWIRLPKDADGEYIQPSDIPRLTKANDGKRLVFYPSLELRQDGTWSLAGWTPDRYRISKPTVEDVLREFANEVYADADNEIRDRDFLCAKYAKRLTLAEKGDA